MVENLERDRFEGFSEMGEKHAFRLRSGQDFLGWVVAVEADALWVEWAPSPFDTQDELSSPEERIPFAEILPDTLEFWDGTTHRWQAYPIDGLSPSANPVGSN